MFVCDYVVVFSLVVLVAAGVLRWWLVDCDFWFAGQLVFGG